MSFSNESDPKFDSIAESEKILDAVDDRSEHESHVSIEE